MHPYVPGVLFGEFPLFQLVCKCLFLVLFWWAHCEGLPALTNGPHSPEVPKWDRLWERGDWIVCVYLFVYMHTRRNRHHLRIFVMYYLAASCFTPTSAILSEQRDLPFILYSVYRTWAVYSSLIINVLNEGRVVDVSACKHKGHTLPEPSLLVGHYINANTLRN